MPPCLKTLEERARCIVQERHPGRWPHTENLLLWLSRLYGLAATARLRFYRLGILKSHRLPCKVISVGNLTAGGTGKTPMTMYIARRLSRSGCRVAVLSRGYKGSAEKRGGVVSDGRNILMDPDTAGDEPHMLAANLPGIPVVVGRDRLRSARLALERFAPDVIILDDAFQHLRIKRDLNLLLLDAKRPFGNGHLLPRGPLRMPVVYTRHADAIIFTRCTTEKWGQRVLQNKLSWDDETIFGSRHIPTLYKVMHSPAGPSCAPVLVPIEPSVLDSAVFGFSGIADNADFERTLHAFGFQVNGFMGFDDHHQYSDEDLELIQNAYTEKQAGWLITTEKDFHRICHRLGEGMRLVVVGIKIEFLPGPDHFDEIVLKLLGTTI